MRRPQTNPLLALRVLLLLLLSFSVSAWAQTFRGGINGSITDASGASIAGAAVSATNSATGVKTTSVASSSGAFLFEDLPLGDYFVTVTAQGFANTKVDHVNVSAGTIYTLPVKLEVSSTTEIVEVNASSLSLDTTTVTQTTVLDAKTVADIPLNGRDFTQMVNLTPGYAGSGAGGYGSLNGTRANQMNWQIDGVDNNDLWHNLPAVNQGGVSGIAGVVLPIDAVDQFSAQTQSAPEAGRNSGGTINLSLKSGTNQLHGTVYYFNRNELFGAKSPFSPSKQKVRNYNTGFSVGGPFIKDKLFGFLTFEHQRFVIGESGTATEPSVGWQSKATAILNSKGIPVNPVMVSVLNSLWGQSTLAQDTVGVPQNFHSNDPEYGYSWNGLGKVDFHPTDKDSVSFRWFVGQGNQVAPVGSQLLSYYEVAPLHVQNIALVYNRILSPTVSNQILVGVNYFNQVFSDFNSTFNVQSEGFETGAAPGNAPNITIGNTSSSGGGTTAVSTAFDPVGLTPPEGRNDITGHLTDQLSWVRGKHEFRFGGEFRQAQLDEFYKRKSVGSFTFDGSRVGGGGYAGALADFLAGQFSAATIAIGDPERQVFVNTWFLNAGDSWQVSRKLNVNYGVRYDYEGPLHEPYQDVSVFRPQFTQTNGLAFQGAQVQDLYQRYFKEISPRVGLSYALADKTVLRAGYGWYFDTPNLNPFLDNRPGNQAPNGVEGNPGGPDPVYTVGSSLASQTITAGQPIFPSSAGYPCSATSPCGVFSVDANFRPSYNQNYNFQLEQSIGTRMVVQLGYVGSEARHLLSILDINQATPGVYQTPANNTNPLLSANYQRQTNRPYFGAYSQYGNINQIESIGTSSYNSMQATLRLSNFYGFSSSTVYTWSHNLDEVSDYRGTLPQDSRNFKGDYGNSEFDVRNTFASFVSYAVPGSQHLKGLTNGWQANGVLSFHGGQPFSVHASGDLSGTNEGNDRVNQIGSPQVGLNGQHPGATWINLFAFQDPTPGTFGTSRRNNFFGPGYSDVDLSVFKNTKLGERLTVQLRAELFNVFNRINYAPPSITFATCPASGISGSGTCTPGQFDPNNGSATLNDTIGDYNGAPGIGAGEPFNAQFGAKIIF